MPPPVPNGFINTAEARKKTTDAGNIIGVVVDVLERKRIIKTNSFCVTFTIKDDDFSAPSWEGGYKARYFSKTEHSIPDVRVGDVFLIRGIRVSPELAGSRANSDGLTVSTPQRTAPRCSSRRGLSTMGHLPPG